MLNNTLYITIKVSVYTYYTIISIHELYIPSLYEICVLTCIVSICVQTMHISPNLVAFSVGQHKYESIICYTTAETPYLVGIFDYSTYIK